MSRGETRSTSGSSQHISATLLPGKSVCSRSSARGKDARGRDTTTKSRGARRDARCRPAARLPRHETRAVMPLLADAPGEPERVQRCLRLVVRGSVERVVLVPHQPVERVPARASNARALFPAAARAGGYTRARRGRGRGERTRAAHRVAPGVVAAPVRDSISHPRLLHTPHGVECGSERRRLLTHTGVKKKVLRWISSYALPNAPPVPAPLLFDAFAPTTRPPRLRDTCLVLATRPRIPAMPP